MSEEGPLLAYYIYDYGLVCDFVQINFNEGGHIVDMLCYYISHLVVVSAQQSAKDMVKTWPVE